MDYPEYRYVDVACGGPFNRNNVQDIRKLTFNGKVDCYKTFFRYPEEFKQRVEKTGSVKGYTGPAYADYFPIDIDNENLEVALASAKKLLLDLGQEDVDVRSFPLFFSGAKGFHIFIPTRVFGCTPSKKISQYFKRLASYLLSPWDVKYDSSIYDLVRIFRTNDSINSKSGLYKIQLDIDELFGSSVAEIREMAKAPRGRRRVNPPAPSDFLSTLFRRACEEEKVEIKTTTETGVLPPKGSKICYHEILKGVTEGGRDIIAYRLACHFKKQAFPEDVVQAMVLAWNKRNAPPLDEKQVIEKVKNAFAENARDDFGCNDEALKKFCNPTCYLKTKTRSDLSVFDVKDINEMETEYERYVKLLAQRMCRIDFPTIGPAMRGIAPGEVLTILARSGVGKTAILINLLLRIGLVNPMPQVFFTMEQPNAQIFERMAQITSAVAGHTVEEIYSTGKAKDEEIKLTKQQIAKAVKERFEHVYFIERDYLTIEQMIETVRLIEQEKIGKKVGLVAVDYLGRMKSDGRDPYKVLSENAQGTKHMAKELDAAVIMLAQVNRKGGDGTQPIFLDSARDSGQIEEASDFLWGMWRPEMHENKEGLEDKLMISLLKNRKGPAPLTVAMKLVKRILRVDAEDGEKKLWVTTSEEERHEDQPW